VHGIPAENLNWRLTVHGPYYPLRCHQSVKCVRGKTLTALLMEHQTPSSDHVTI